MNGEEAEESSMELELVQSQASGLSQASGVSQASDVSSNSGASGLIVDCRECKEPIVLDNVKEYTACTLPSGSVHFACHFVCLGLYPKGASERRVIKSSTKCPKHCNS